MTSKKQHNLLTQECLRLLSRGARTKTFRGYFCAKSGCFFGFAFARSRFRTKRRDNFNFASAQSEQKTPIPLSPKGRRHTFVLRARDARRTFWCYFRARRKDKIYFAFARSAETFCSKPFLSLAEELGLLRSKAESKTFDRGLK